MLRVFLSSALLVGLAGPAYAYVDPGTASIALQALIGGLAAASLFFRTKIAAFFSFFRRGEKKSDGAKDDASASSQKPDDR